MGGGGGGKRLTKTKKRYENVSENEGTKERTGKKGEREKEERLKK